MNMLVDVVNLIRDIDRLAMAVFVVHRVVSVSNLDSIEGGTSVDRPLERVSHGAAVELVVLRGVHGVGSRALPFDIQHDVLEVSPLRLVIVHDGLRASVHRHTRVHFIHCVIVDYIGHLLVACQVFQDQRVFEDSSSVLGPSVDVRLVFTLNVKLCRTAIALITVDVALGRLAPITDPLA